MNNYIIRPERREDWREVENLTREAFWNVYRPGCLEHYVLHNLRAEDCFIPELSYCIEENGKIAAHIAYAKAEVTGDDGIVRDVAIFGPVSVLPEMQKRGYGSALINHTLGLAKDMGIPLILITGNQDYYKRFGFVSASLHGIFYSGMDRADEAPFFMVKILDEEKSKDIKGVYSDPPVYMADENDADEFDKTFPHKEKLKLPGQLF